MPVEKCGSYWVVIPMTFKAGSGKAVTVAGSLMRGGLRIRRHAENVDATGRGYQERSEELPQKFTSARLGPDCMLRKALISEGVSEADIDAQMQVPGSVVRFSVDFSYNQEGDYDRAKRLIMSVVNSYKVGGYIPSRDILLECLQKIRKIPEISEEVEKCRFQISGTEGYMSGTLTELLD